MYQVVIIGAGNIAAGFDSPQSQDILTHAHVFSTYPGFSLRGFYDTDLEKAKEAARIWGGQAYESMGQAMEDTDIMICCVPDSYHGQVLRETASYCPKLIVVEKPVAGSLEEAERIFALYQHKIPIAVNYSRRYIKEIQELKKDIKNYGRFLKGIGYYGKGLMHNGSHMLDLLNYFFGDIQDVQAVPGSIYDYEKTDLSKDAVLKIQDSLFYMVAIDSRLVTIFEIELFFQKFRIRILDGGAIIEKYKVEASGPYEGYKKYVLWKEQNINSSRAMLGLAENIKGFLDHGKELECTIEDGISVLKTCKRIEEKVRE